MGCGVERARKHAKFANARRVSTEVGPLDVVDTLAEGDVVRQAIHHLFNNGSPYVGYVALAHLLFSDHDNWDMGATFES